MPPDKHLESKCRNLLAEHQDVLDLVLKRVFEEVDKEQVTGSDAFEYAKKTIRKEAIKEGIKMFLSKINAYAAR